MVEWDVIPNWLALIIELGIAIPFAIFLTIFFYKKQKKQGDELEKITKKQEKIIVEHEELRQKRKRAAVLSLIISLDGLRANIYVEKQGLQALYHPRMSLSSKVKIKEKIDESQKDRNRARHLENIINISFDVLESELQTQLSIISAHASRPYDLNDEKKDKELCDNIMNLIDTVFDTHLKSYVLRRVEGNKVTVDLIGFYEKREPEQNNQYLNISEPIVTKEGITIYPDGMRVDSHGTIL